MVLKLNSRRLLHQTMSIPPAGPLGIFERRVEVTLAHRQLCHRSVYRRGPVQWNVCPGQSWRCAH
ncbi:hypothetical protein EXN66_Car008211 [Channa argus]|uniref:Uncharacterized protein n=1 Tax=Channa argus TaxID=215402 RepID=A0A6G1PQH9_CHAAH|nr:hypothetical protein EXN66_Car008211 [Channa argus]